MAKIASLIVIGLLGIAAAALLVSGAAPPKLDNTAVVVVLPLTGNRALVGDAGKFAVLLAEKELKAAGNSVGFLVVDGKDNPAEAVAAMRSEKSVRNRRVFVATLSASSLAATAAFVDEDVAVIAVARHPGLAIQCRSVIEFGTSAAQEAEMLADKLVKSSGRIGIAASREFATIAEVDRFLLPKLREADKTPAFVEWFDAGNGDFRGLTGQIKSTRPSDIVLLMDGADLAAALEAISVAADTDKLTIYGGAGLADLKTRPEGFAKTRFQIAAPLFAVDTDNPQTQRFRKAYEAIAGRAPSYEAAFIYDAAMLLGDLIHRGNQTPKDITVSLRGLSYEGIAGVTDIGADGNARADLRWATFGASSLAPLEN